MLCHPKGLGCGTRDGASIPPLQVRADFALTLKQLFAPDPLAVSAIPNLDPTRRLLREVRAVFLLCHNPLKVVLSSQPE